MLFCYMRGCPESVVKRHTPSLLPNRVDVFFFLKEWLTNFVWSVDHPFYLHLTVHPVIKMTTGLFSSSFLNELTVKPHRPLATSSLTGQAVLHDSSSSTIRSAASAVRPRLVPTLTSFNAHVCMWCWNFFLSTSVQCIKCYSYNHLAVPIKSRVTLSKGTR
jgi:hypothetical protein